MLSLGFSVTESMLSPLTGRDTLYSTEEAAHLGRFVKTQYEGYFADGLIGCGKLCLYMRYDCIVNH